MEIQRMISMQLFNKDESSATFQLALKPKVAQKTIIRKKLGGLMYGREMGTIFVNTSSIIVKDKIRHRTILPMKNEIPTNNNSAQKSLKKRGSMLSNSSLLSSMSKTNKGEQSQSKKLKPRKLNDYVDTESLLQMQGEADKVIFEVLSPLFKKQKAISPNKRPNNLAKNTEPLPSTHISKQTSESKLNCEGSTYEIRQLVSPIEPQTPQTRNKPLTGF